jgi:hypothetical protein
MRNILSMSVEFWNSVFQWGSVLLVAVTFVFGAGALWTSNRINARQTERLVALETALASAKTELAEQQERAAKAEIELAALRRNALPRSITFDTEAFVAELKDAPRSNVVLWYVPGDHEVYDLSTRIAGALHLAGWTPAPVPIPIPETETHEALSGTRRAETMSPLARVGGQYGVTLTARTMPFGPLMRAIGKATSGQVATFADPRLPEGVIRVIVGPKPP